MLDNNAKVSVRNLNYLYGWTFFETNPCYVDFDLFKVNLVCFVVFGKKQKG